MSHPFLPLSGVAYNPFVFVDGKSDPEIIASLIASMLPSGRSNDFSILNFEPVHWVEIAIGEGAGSLEDWCLDTSEAWLMFFQQLFKDSSIVVKEVDLREEGEVGLRMHLGLVKGSAQDVHVALTKAYPLLNIEVDDVPPF